MSEILELAQVLVAIDNFDGDLLGRVQDLNERLANIEELAALLSVGEGTYGITEAMLTMLTEEIEKRRNQIVKAGEATEVPIHFEPHPLPIKKVPQNVPPKEA